MCVCPLPAFFFSCCCPNLVIRWPCFLHLKSLGRDTLIFGSYLLALKNTGLCDAQDDLLAANGRCNDAVFHNATLIAHHTQNLQKLEKLRDEAVFLADTKTRELVEERELRLANYVADVRHLLITYYFRQFL
jgi:hypothetical protein